MFRETPLVPNATAVHHVIARVAILAMLRVITRREWHANESIPAKGMLRMYHGSIALPGCGPATNDGDIPQESSSGRADLVAQSASQ